MRCTPGDRGAASVCAGVGAGILNAVGVHLADLRLRDFRNYGRLDAEFTPGLHLLLGDNAQGKTNILEAIYLMATLRSFRGVGGAQMIRHGQKGYYVGGSVVSRAAHEIKDLLVAERAQIEPGRPDGAQIGGLSGGPAGGGFLHRRPAVGQRHGAAEAALHGPAAGPEPCALSALAAPLHDRPAMPQRAAQRGRAGPGRAGRLHAATGRGRGRS